MIGRPTPYGYGLSYYRNVVFKDPNWTYDQKHPNFGSDIDRADRVAGAIDHKNPDLSGFVKKGGKLLLVGGWVDDLPVQNVITYYDSVLKTMGASARDSVRLFIVPGMHHCFGVKYPPATSGEQGAGTYTVDFDPVAAVRAWKTSGQAPDSIVVQTSGNGWPDRKRLVCAYPNVSKYKGSGDTSDPRNFSCAKP
jgi:feruloyl esterase